MFGFNNVHLKATRAKEHLDALEREIGRFQEENARTLNIEEGTKAGHFSFKFPIPPIPPRIGLIACDFFYCLRSSLDYLAWQLAPNDRTSFPIFGFENPGAFDRATKDIPTDAKTIIKSLQPYHRGDAYRDDPLWKLDKFCNIAKHRQIPAYGTTREVSGVVPQGTTFQSLDNGDIVITYPEGKFSEMQLDPNLPIDVILGDAYDGIEATFGDLVGMYKIVTEDVIPRFAGFLK